MRTIIILIFCVLLCCFHVHAQKNGLKLTGTQFFALSVSNTDSASAWYESMFGLKLLKEIKPADMPMHIRIIGNENLLVEIGMMQGSKSLADCGLNPDDAHKMNGFFKVGFFVADIKQAENYFKGKKVVIRHGPFDDADTATTAFIIEDPFGNMIQVLQRK
jgi:predicted enzyme related to lactoylglutathione lyase